jgi:hypothetical protein
MRTFSERRSRHRYQTFTCTRNPNAQPTNATRDHTRQVWSGMWGEASVEKVRWSRSEKERWDTFTERRRQLRRFHLGRMGGAWLDVPLPARASGRKWHKRIMAEWHRQSVRRIRRAGRSTSRSMSFLLRPPCQTTFASVSSPDHQSNAPEGLDRTNGNNSRGKPGSKFYNQRYRYPLFAKPIMPTQPVAPPPARHDMSVILVTGSYDHEIRFWEAWSGICSRTIARSGESGVRHTLLSTLLLSPPSYDGSK